MATGAPEQPSEALDGAVRWLPKSLLTAAGGLALVCLGYWLFCLQSAHQVGQSESFILNLCWWWRHGVSYNSLDGYPCVLNPYGPVYPWLLSRLPLCASHPYLPGRLVSLVSSLGLLALLYRYVVRHTNDRAAAWLAVCVLGSSRPFLLFSPLCRVDMLGHLLAFGGLVLASQGNSQRQRWIGLGLLGLAAHVKLTMVAAALAVGSHWWRTDRRRALLGALVWLAMAGGGVALLNVVTDGGFLANVVRPPSLWQKGFEVIGRPLFASPFLVAAVILLALTRPDLHGVFRTERHYLIAAFGVACASGANWGSSWNYLIAPYLALSLVLGLMLGRRPEQPLDSLTPGRRRAVVVLLWLHIVFAVGYAFAVMAREQAQRALDRQCQHHAEEVLKPYLESALPVVCVGSEVGTDVLLMAGRLNAFDLQGLYEQRLDTACPLLSEWLASGRVGAVFAGNQMVPWDPVQPLPPPAPRAPFTVFGFGL